MDEHLVTISGLGLCSSLGGYKDACAAYRAGLNRFSAHEEMMNMEAGDEEPTPITVAPAATNLWQYQGVGRSIKMLHLAYLDLIANYQQAIPTDGLQLLLAMPDPEDRALDMDPMPGISRADRLQEYIDAVTGPLLAKMGGEFSHFPVQCVFGDRVAFARILQKATEMLSNGSAQHCLLLVADSLLDDDMLDAQLDENLIKHDGNPAGYIPGEGAAMLLLSANAATNSKANISAKISVNLNSETIDFDDEEADLNQWQGEKLAELFSAQTQANYNNQVFPQLVCDLNGEERRAIELSCILIKLRLAHPNAHFNEPQVPALGFGETGTMMGPIALATSMASIQRGYANQRNLLISLSEDNGKRGVIQIQF